MALSFRYAAVNIPKRATFSSLPTPICRLGKNLHNGFGFSSKTDHTSSSRSPLSHEQTGYKYSIPATRGSGTARVLEENEKQSSENWKIKMLYDGECPLCMREVNMLRERNKSFGTIKFVDISYEDYSPQENQGLDYRTVMGRIHAILSDGTVVTDIEAFRKLYEAVGLGWVYAITKYEPIATIADAVYDIWAKYRLQITGRPPLEEVLEARKNKLDSTLVTANKLPFLAVNFTKNFPPNFMRVPWMFLPPLRKWELHSTAQSENTVLCDEEEKSWDACRQALSVFEFTVEEEDKILGKAFGYMHSPYWTEERKKEVPRFDVVSEILNYLRSLNLTDDDLCKLLKKFPEVLGCSLEDELRNNVKVLEKDWGIEGKTLKNLLMRNPKILGYNVDCKGDCMAQCTRCWVRF